MRAKFLPCAAKDSAQNPLWKSSGTNQVTLATSTLEVTTSGALCPCEPYPQGGHSAVDPTRKDKGHHFYQVDRV